MENDELNDSTTSIPTISSIPDPDTTTFYDNIDYSLKTEEDLNEWLDSTQYIGINDHGYRIFSELYDCNEVTEIANDFLSDSRKALYAYYKLTFGECRISSEEAISWIEKFESSTDTFGVWIFSTMNGQRTLAEEAANAIWENKSFPLDQEQYDYVTRIRNL